MARTIKLTILAIISVALAIMGGWNMIVAVWLNYDGYQQIVLMTSLFWIGLGIMVWLDRQ